MSYKLKICFFLSVMFILINNTYQNYYFRLLQLNSGQIIIVSNSYIYLQEKDINTPPTIKLNLDSSSELTTQNDHRQISIAQYSEDQSGYILCKVKQTIYLISPDFNFICSYTGLSISNDNVIIIPYKQNENFYFYFICYLNKNDSNSPIHIEKYSFNKDSCTNVLINNLSLMPKNSLGKPLYPQSICFDCNLMYNDILICFFTIINLFEVGYVSFDIKNDITLLEEFSGTNGIQNSQASWLRTTQSQDKTKVFCCFVNDVHEIYCSIYDITKNKWSNEIKILPKVSPGTDSFYINYFYETNE